MEIKKRNLVLTFGTPAKTEVDVVISKPQEQMDAAQVKAGMQAMIDSGALGENILVNSMVEAKYVIQQEDAVALN